MTGEGGLVSLMLPSIRSALSCQQQVCQRTTLFRRQPSPTLWDFTDKPRDTTGPGTWCVDSPHRSGSHIKHNRTVSPSLHILDLKFVPQDPSHFMWLKAGVEKIRETWKSTLDFETNQPKINHPPKHMLSSFSSFTVSNYLMSHLHNERKQLMWLLLAVKLAC